MRRTGCVVAALVLAVGLVGCKSKEAAVVETGPSVDAYQYQRIALVCGPGEGASPEYVKTILDGVRPMVPTRLGFLAKADVLDEVTPDGSAVPPKVNLGAKASAYDGIACMIYSYGEGLVNMDIYMLDARTGEQVWHHRLQTKDNDIQKRLNRHAYWTPTTLKMKFYKHDQ